MKYDEKAIKEAIRVFYSQFPEMEIEEYEVDDMQAAISAYCEKAGVDMVPREQIQSLYNNAETIAFLHRSDNEVLAFCELVRQMIRASQEEE